MPKTHKQNAKVEAFLTVHSSLPRLPEAQRKAFLSVWAALQPTFRTAFPDCGKGPAAMSWRTPSRLLDVRIDPLGRILWRIEEQEGGYEANDEPEPWAAVEAKVRGLLADLIMPDLALIEFDETERYNLDLQMRWWTDGHYASPSRNARRMRMAARVIGNSAMAHLRRNAGREAAFQEEVAARLLRESILYAQRAEEAEED